MPRNKRSSRRTSEAGFTLVELLVALTLLGLIMAVIFGELRFTTRAWDATDAKLDRNSELMSVHAFLRTRFQQMHVPRATRRDDDLQRDIFEGNSRSVEFLATMPDNVSQGGFYEISLSSENGDDGDDLFISWRPFDEDGVATVADTHDNSRVLLRGLSEVRFSYFGKTNDSVAAQWWDNWPARDRAPSLVRLQITFGDDDPRVWPELTVSPATATTVLAQQ